MTPPSAAPERPQLPQLALQAALICGQVPRLWPFGFVILLLSFGSLRFSADVDTAGVHVVVPPFLQTLLREQHSWFGLLLAGWLLWLTAASLIGTLAHGTAITIGDAARSGRTARARRTLRDTMRRWGDLLQIELLCGLPLLPAAAAALSRLGSLPAAAGRLSAGELAVLSGVLLLWLPVGIAALVRPFALRSCLLEGRSGPQSVLRALQLLYRRRLLLLRAWLLVAALTLIYLIPGSLLLTSTLPALSAALLSGLPTLADLPGLLLLLLVALGGGLLHSYVAVFWTLIFREMTV